MNSTHILCIFICIFSKHNAAVGAQPYSRLRFADAAAGVKGGLHVQPRASIRPA